MLTKTNIVLAMFWGTHKHTMSTMSWARNDFDFDFSAIAI